MKIQCATSKNDHLELTLLDESKLLCLSVILSGLDEDHFELDYSVVLTPKTALLLADALRKYAFGEEF